MFLYILEQLQRTIERAEDFEQSSREVDTRVRETQERSKEMETLVANNMEKEETFEAKVSFDLTPKLSGFEN